MKNPFLTNYHGLETGHVDAESRLSAVKNFDKTQLLAALEVDGLQKAVRVAIKRRLKKLEKANG